MFALKLFILLALATFVSYVNADCPPPKQPTATCQEAGFKCTDKAWCKRKRHQKNNPGCGKGQVCCSKCKFYSGVGCKKNCPEGWAVYKYTCGRWKTCCEKGPLHVTCQKAGYKCKDRRWCRNKRHQRDYPGCGRGQVCCSKCRFYSGVKCKRNCPKGWAVDKYTCGRRKTCCEKGPLHVTCQKAGYKCRDRRWCRNKRHQRDYPGCGRGQVCCSKCRFYSGVKCKRNCPEGWVVGKYTCGGGRTCCEKGPAPPTTTATPPPPPTTTTPPQITCQQVGFKCKDELWCRKKRHQKHYPGCGKGEVCCSKCKFYRGVKCKRICPKGWIVDHYTCGKGKTCCEKGSPPPTTCHQAGYKCKDKFWCHKKRHQKNYPGCGKNEVCCSKCTFYDGVKCKRRCKEEQKESRYTCEGRKTCCRRHRRKSIV